MANFENMCPDCPALLGNKVTSSAQRGQNVITITEDDAVLVTQFNGPGCGARYVNVTDSPGASQLFENAKLCDSPQGEKPGMFRKVLERMNIVEPRELDCPASLMLGDDHNARLILDRMMTGEPNGN